MKKTFLFLSILVVSCVPKEERPDQTANSIDVLNHLYLENASKLSMVEKAISMNGYAKDTLFLKAAAALLNNSDAAVNKKQPLKEHYEFLFEKYNSLPAKDTASLNRTHGFLEKFIQNSDSVDYYNYLQNALLLESEIMDFYCAQIGAYRPIYNTMLFKEDVDTARVNNLYTFVIIPADYRFSYSKVIVDSTVEIKVDDKKIILPIHYTQAGGAVIASLTPTQKGKYYIRGKISVLQKASKYTQENMYSNSFIVK